MAGTGPSFSVGIFADTKQFSKAMRDAGNDTDRFEQTLKGFGIAAGAAFAAAGAAAVLYIGKSVKAASDLEQSIGGVESVFKEYSSAVEESSKVAAEAVGLSRNSYNQLATIIGTQLKAAGTSLDSLAGKTDGLIGISADLAATFGGPVVDAANAVTSALRGEFEPLRRYGIALSVAQIEAHALEMTSKTLASELTAAEKAAAAQDLIFRGAADAAGAFERESDTLAGKQERLKASLENISASVGEAFLPAIVDATDKFGLFVDELTSSPEFQKFLTDTSNTLSGMIPTLDDVLESFQELITNILPVMSELLGPLADVLGLVASGIGLVSTEASDSYTPLSDLITTIGNLAYFADLAFTALDDLSNGLDTGGSGWVTALNYMMPVTGQLQLLADLTTALRESLPALERAINGTSTWTDVDNLMQSLPIVGQWWTPRGVSGAQRQRGAVPFADGGIVMPRPGGTRAIIGEAGQAEAVIPLDRLETMMGKGSGTTVIVQGNVGWSPQQLADIVDRKQRQALALAGLNGIVGVR